MVRKGTKKTPKWAIICPTMDTKTQFWLIKRCDSKHGGNDVPMLYDPTWEGLERIVVPWKWRGLEGAARWAQFPATILSKVFICQSHLLNAIGENVANNDHRLGWDGRPGYALRSCGVRFFHICDLPSSSLLSDYQAFVLPNLPSW